MYGYFYHGFAALWTLALFCIVCKICASGGEKIKRKQEQREQEKAFLERQAQQRELLRTLSSGERRVLSRVLSSTSGGAWVRVDDVPATVLLHKGLLTTVSRGISGRYNARIDDYERCILVGIPEDLKEAAADVLKGDRRNKKARAPAGKTRAEP